MNFTAKDVQALREKTGCGMMDCKKALVECDGDLDKAVDFLREKGLASQAKKSSRIAAEGQVVALASDKAGVVLEVNCETDFVAGGDGFKALCTLPRLLWSRIRPMSMRSSPAPKRARPCPKWFRIISWSSVRI